VRVLLPCASHIICVLISPAPERPFPIIIFEYSSEYYYSIQISIFSRIQTFYYCKQIIQWSTGSVLFVAEGLG
jgi:hypothetical protein